MPKEAQATPRAAAPLSVDPATLVDVELSAVVASAVERFRAEAAARRLRLLASLAPRCVVRGDTARLGDAAVAVLSRALDSTPDGGSIVITLTRDEARATLRVVIEDEGIDAAMLSRVFEPLAGDPPLSSSNAGRARDSLGMALTRDTVLMHGGAVSVESPGKGEGTTFSIQLPINGCTPVASSGSSRS